VEHHGCTLCFSIGSVSVRRYIHQVGFSTGSGLLKLLLTPDALGKHILSIKSVVQTKNYISFPKHLSFRQSVCA